MRPVYVTLDPSAADMFLVPTFAACYLFNCWLDNGWDLSGRCEVDERLLAPILDHIQRDRPHWARSGGADHVFLHPMDHGDAYYGEEVRRRMRNATHLVTRGDRRTVMRHRDIVIPSATHLLHSYRIRPRDYVDVDGHPLVEPIAAAVEPADVHIYAPSTGVQATAQSTRRTTIAVFRGLGADTQPNDTYSLGVRSLFFRGFASLPGYDIAATTDVQEDYARALARSRYGLLAPGHTLDTTRLWELLAFGYVRPPQPSR